jgi:hypothetical protein
MAKFITVRVIKSGGSLVFTLPPKWRRANNLKAGDMLRPDFDTFGIIRLEGVETLCEEPNKVEVEDVPV